MSIYKMSTKNWFLEKTIFLIAGIFTSLSVILGLTLSSGFFYFTALVGLMQIIFALSGYCPMAILLTKLGVKEKQSN